MIPGEHWQEQKFLLQIPMRSPQSHTGDSEARMDFTRERRASQIRLGIEEARAITRPVDSFRPDVQPSINARRLRETAFERANEAGRVFIPHSVRDFLDAQVAG
jgi:hypothetical protein